MMNTKCSLFCDCPDCKRMWAKQEVYDAAHPMQAATETINYEVEKERDRDLGEPLGAYK